MSDIKCFKHPEQDLNLANLDCDICCGLFIEKRLSGNSEKNQDVPSRHNSYQSRGENKIVASKDGNVRAELLDHYKIIENSAKITTRV